MEERIKSLEDELRGLKAVCDKLVQSAMLQNIMTQNADRAIYRHIESIKAECFCDCSANRVAKKTYREDNPRC